MIWANSFDRFLLFSILAFGFLYLIYLLRVVKVARTLQVPAYHVIWKLILRFLYFSLFVVALLGPSFGETSKEVKAIGKDIYLCVDLSQSMDAFDIQPTRLEKVKFELKTIIDAFNSDRKGIIIFSNEAFMQCPLTYDNNALNIFIQTLHTSLVPNSGTDFGPPLKMALEKLQKEGNVSTQQKSKIIVLISDGEDFGEETAEIADEVEQSGIKLFALGVGTDRGSRIQTNRGYKLDRNGQEVVTQLNSSSLRKLAADTGGKY
ncbi:MAG: VWA domain-containing protein, partial [Cyclobacteriaceae bacterium]|nr:VWA domain-containing protein [Cyclobacteriaceae bacterium]